MPPLTPSSTRAPDSGASAAPGPIGSPSTPGHPSGSPVCGLLDGGGHVDRTVPVQLALAKLLARHRERRAVGTGVDHRRHELADALAELRVVAVDLPRAPRGQDHQRVLGVDPSQQVVDPRFDHASSAFSRLDPLPTGPGPRPPGGAAATSLTFGPLSYPA